MAKFRVDKFDEYYVVRDDILSAGTKSRVLRQYLQRRAPNATDFVYCSSPFGYAQIALADAAKKLKKRVHVFLPKRNQLTVQSQVAQGHGAVIHEISPGYMSVLRCRAREFIEKNNSDEYFEVPFGLKDDLFVDLLKKTFVRLLTRARERYPVPNRIWMVWGSGAMATAFDRALAELKYPTKIVVVQVGALMPARSLWPPRVTQAYVAPEKFSKEAKHVPPYPSNAYYDAKIWQYVCKHGQPGDWVWNVAK